jgi:hypothetical protein
MSLWSLTRGNPISKIARVLLSPLALAAGALSALPASRSQRAAPGVCRVDEGPTAEVVV